MLVNSKTSIGLSIQNMNTIQDNYLQKKKRKMRTIHRSDNSTIDVARSISVSGFDVSPLFRPRDLTRMSVFRSFFLLVWGLGPQIYHNYPCTTYTWNATNPGHCPYTTETTRITITGQQPLEQLLSPPYRTMKPGQLPLRHLPQVLVRGVHVA